MDTLRIKRNGILQKGCRFCCCLIIGVDFEKLFKYALEKIGCVPDYNLHMSLPPFIYNNKLLCTKELK